MSNTKQNTKALTVEGLIDYLSSFDPKAIVKIGGLYDMYYSTVTKDMIELVVRNDEVCLVIQETP